MHIAARVSKYRLEIAFKRARIMLEENNKRNEEFNDLTNKEIDIASDNVLLKN